MGDSITAGWGVDWLVPGAVNKGIPGELPSEMLARFQRDVLDLQPARVHILGGANCLMLYGMAEPEAIIEMARRAVAAGARTYVGTVTPRADWPPGTGVEEFNEALRLAAPVVGYTLVDYYAVMSKPLYFDPDLYRDIVHPNAAGYARMERVLLEVML
jgi:hypothetical protein